MTTAEPMTHLSLFSGIGGLDLAAEMAGMETVGQCEWADYPTKILERHWPGVARWRDIRTLTAESFYEKTGRRTVDVISGGFPCQPFSVAGSRKGRADDRFLWPEMLRVIRELAPRWVVGENVPGILRIASDDVCKDLEREGYDVGIFDFEAAAVGAPHRRERIAFVANSVGRGRREVWQRGCVATVRGGRANDTMPSAQSSEDVADAESTERERRRGETRKWWAEFGRGCWWAVEPDVGRVASRFSEKLDGGGLSEQNGGKESGTARSSDDGKMREVRSDGRKNEPSPYRLFRLYGGASAVHKMPCGGTFDAQTYCDVCGVRESVRGEGSQKSRQDLQPGMSCGVWEGMRDKALGQFWREEPRDVPRVASGVKNRVDRLKCLGNAVVPQQFYPIFKAIAEVEHDQS